MAPRVPRGPFAAGFGGRVFPSPSNGLRDPSGKEKGRASGTAPSVLGRGRGQPSGGQALDLLDQARQLPRRHVGVQDALLRTAHDERLRVLEGFLGGGGVAAGDGRLDLADRGAHGAQARAVDLRAAGRLTNAFFGRGMMCHLDTLF